MRGKDCLLRARAVRAHGRAAGTEVEFVRVGEFEEANWLFVDLVADAIVLVRCAAGARAERRRVGRADQFWCCVGHFGLRLSCSETR